MPVEMVETRETPTSRNWMKLKNKKHGSSAAGPDEPAVAKEGHDAGGGAAGSGTAAEPAPAGKAVPAANGAEADKKAADDRYLRLMADFENFRKRTLREKNDLYRIANEDIILELLPVLDHMDLALEAVRTAPIDAVVLDGFKIVAEQLAAAMRKFGVEPIEADGQVFDPVVHEAISHLPSDTAPENRVIQQTRRGYRLGNKMLRAAQVVVSSGPAPKVEAPPAEDPGKKEE